jgi:hypothetical protein
MECQLAKSSFFVYHRGKMEKVGGTDFYKKYRDMTLNKDLIVGNIANDRMFYVIDNFFDKEHLSKSLSEYFEEHMSEC